MTNWSQEATARAREQIRALVTTCRWFEERKHRLPSGLIDRIVELRRKLPDDDAILTECDPPRSLLVAIDRARRFQSQGRLES